MNWIEEKIQNKIFTEICNKLLMRQMCFKHICRSNTLHPVTDFKLPTDQNMVVVHHRFYDLFNHSTTFILLFKTFILCLSKVCGRGHCSVLGYLLCIKEVHSSACGISYTFVIIMHAIWIDSVRHHLEL